MSVPMVPNVWVIPPEEDGPPFCCFDAADPLERYVPSEEDLQGPGSALEIISTQFSTHNSSPVFHRAEHTTGNIVMPRRSDGRSIEDVLVNARNQSDLYQDPEITIRGSSNSSGDDSEIVEIIKVRRHERGMQQSSPPSSVSEPAIKPSKSFISRASKAFKNVRRSVSRSRIPAVADDLPSDAESSRSPSPAPSRRSSMIFSSLFSHSPSLQSRYSFDSFNEPSSSSPIEASHSNPLDIQMHCSPSSAEMHGFVPHPDTDEEEDCDGDEEIQNTPRAPPHRPHPSTLVRSPSPTARVSRRRFSVLNLFSAGRESEDSESLDTRPSTPIVTSPSTPSLPTSPRVGPSRTDSTESSASSGPTTPVDDVFPSPSLPRRPSTSLLKRLPSFSRSPRKSKASVLADAPKAPSPALEVAGEDDLGFGEMRLDSLHFDEMSFDASRF
ncbi:hypothetical protein GYMLUDRAFT_57507 [Collybiopsis luxurians FD-317 M1]|uniref:Unplaced genomic scaffold GYMLUscaffold_15, whole genome shotgun sequence n=1 Tax=Collybiopsis luxurians FD-317 M1 TaxID=944289 RepID=A0A0D0CLK9_9AGAR|nr:hypothetical protein GYMLUDRAFT_57507 [Collybiopsis luxurians FD-317 M1]